MSGAKKIKVIETNISESKLYFKEYFIHLRKKLKIAQEIKKEDVETSFLICFANIEGMAAAWESRFNLSFGGSGDRFRKFIKNFCNLPYVKDQGLENHFWGTYRCSLAHSGLIQSLFIDSRENNIPQKMQFMSSFEVEKGKTVNKRLDGEYIQLSSKVIFEIFENLINNFESYVKQKSDKFDNDFFTLSSIKCAKCKKCYPSVADKCVFCGSKTIF